MDPQFILDKKHQLMIAAVLMLAMLLTRSNLIGHVQDMSWAVFFLLGFYLRSYRGFPIFWLVAFAIDLVVVEYQGVGNYCFTVSYPFLIPAYASLWFAGRWLAGHYQENSRGMVLFVVAAVVSITVCDLISSGGFYWFSGRFADLSMNEFISRTVTYLPTYLKTTMFYLGVAAAFHVAILQTRKVTTQAHHSG